MSQTWLGQVIVENCGFVTETPALDEGGKARRLAGESIQQFLQRITELENQVRTQQTRIYPKLTNGEICPRLLFDFNESILTPESRNIIERQLGPWLKMYPAVAAGGLIVRGWADSVGTDEACRQVSLQRAQNVAAYLTRTLGYPVKAEGMGKSFDPPNTSELNKQQNRRVVILAASPASPAAAVSPAAKHAIRKPQSG
jgi:outer membrane protein OmpA-like peptidoglycan-associated protein